MLTSSFAGPALVSLFLALMGAGVFSLWYRRGYGPEPRGLPQHPWINKHGHLLRAVVRPVFGGAPAYG